MSNEEVIKKIASQQKNRITNSILRAFLCFSLGVIIILVPTSIYYKESTISIGYIIGLIIGTSLFISLPLTIFWLIFDLIFTTLVTLAIKKKINEGGGINKFPLFSYKKNKSYFSKLRFYLKGAQDVIVLNKNKNKKIVGELLYSGKSNEGYLIKFPGLYFFVNAEILDDKNYLNELSA